MNNDEYLKHLKRWNETIFEGDGTLNPIDEKEVDTLIKWIEMQKKYLDFYQFEFEKVKMYNSQKSDLLKVTNPSEAKETIISRASEDEKIIDEAISLVKENEILRDSRKPRRSVSKRKAGSAPRPKPKSARLR